MSTLFVHHRLFTETGCEDFRFRSSHAHFHRRISLSPIPLGLASAAAVPGFSSPISFSTMSSTIQSGLNRGPCFSVPSKLTLSTCERAAYTCIVRRLAMTGWVYCFWMRCRRRGEGKHRRLSGFQARCNCRNGLLTSGSAQRTEDGNSNDCLLSGLWDNVLTGWPRPVNISQIFFFESWVELCVFISHAKPTSLQTNTIQTQRNNQAAFSES